MSISGRRPNERARRIGRGLLDGLSMIGTVLADGPKQQRIEEIDAQIAELRQERDHLIRGLIEPGDLKVSEDYDPRWRKKESETDERDPFDFDPFAAMQPESVKQDAGRLTKCPGRATSSVYDRVHPGCPYRSGIHGAHEFTLRD